MAMNRKMGESVIGLVSLVLWIVLFGAGLMVSSENYRKSLAQSFTVSNFLKAGLLYTYTNVMMLTCLAGLLGGISSRITFQGYEGSVGQIDSPSSKTVSLSTA